MQRRAQAEELADARERLIATLIAEGAFAPETSVPGPTLAALSDVPMAQFIEQASRIVADGYAVLPVRQADGWLTGLYLCGDPAVLDAAAADLQKQADRIADQSAWYRSVAEHLRRRESGENEGTARLGGGN